MCDTTNIIILNRKDNKFLRAADGTLASVVVTVATCIVVDDDVVAAVVVVVVVHLKSCVETEKNAFIVL